MMGTPPLVSVMIGTMAGRKPFLRQAVKYFLGQDYPAEKLELIVLDDDPAPGDLGFIDHPRIKYVHFDSPVMLGKKLNTAISQYAHGDFLVKLDDDDWHSPRLVSSILTRLHEEDPKKSMTVLRGYPVFMLREWVLKDPPEKIRAGTAMAFHRRVWARKQYREDLPVEDTIFFKDHAEDSLSRDIWDSTLLVMIRHGIGHLWRHVGAETHGDYLLRAPDHKHMIEDILPSEDLEFYKRMRAELWPEKAKASA